MRIIIKNKYSISTADKVFLFFTFFLPLLILIFIFISKPVSAGEPEILLLEGQTPIAYGLTRLKSSESGSLCITNNTTSFYYKALSDNTFTKITNPTSQPFNWCQVSDDLQSIVLGGGWGKYPASGGAGFCSASNNGGSSFTAYNTENSSAACVDVSVSSNGQHFGFNHTKTLISNDYLNSFQAIDWSGNQSNYKRHINCSDTGVCISSMSWWQSGRNMGININNGFSNNYYLQNFHFEQNSISPSGKYMCFVNTYANISGVMTEQNRIYFSNNYLLNEVDYFTNTEKFTNCFVDDGGKMYLWGLDFSHNDRNKVVYLDLNKPEQPAQIFLEMELKTNVRIASFTGSAQTNKYFFSEQNGLIYQYEPNWFNPPNVPSGFEYPFLIHKEFSDFSNGIFYHNNEDILIFENQDPNNFEIIADFYYPQNYLDYTAGIIRMAIKDSEGNFVKLLPTTKVINSNNLPNPSDVLLIDKDTGFEMNTCQNIEILVQFNRQVINYENIVFCLYDGLMPDSDKYIFNLIEIDKNFPFQKTYDKLSNKIIFGTFINLEQNFKNLFTQLKDTSKAKNSNMKLYFEGQSVDLLEIKDNSTKGIYDFIYNISTMVFYVFFIVYIIFRARTFINND